MTGAAGAIATGAAVIAAVVVVLVALAVLARWLRRTARTGPAITAAMAAYDEAMHSTAHTAYIEAQSQKDRTVAAPAPDGNGPASAG